MPRQEMKSVAAIGLVIVVSARRIDLGPGDDSVIEVRQLGLEGGSLGRIDAQS